MAGRAGGMLSSLLSGVKRSGNGDGSNAIAATTTAAAVQSNPDDAIATDPSSPSRAELLDKVRVLTEKNKRFETRFRDVVQAYKSLMKENAALKDTVDALTTPSNDGAAANGAAAATAAAAVTATTTTSIKMDEAATTLIENERDMKAAAEEEEYNASSSSSSAAAAATMTAEEKTAEAAAASGGVEMDSADLESRSSEARDENTTTIAAATPAATPQPKNKTLPVAPTTPAPGTQPSQIQALTEAIRTITAEKASVTAQFQLDKKTVAIEHRAALAELQRRHEEALSEAQRKAHQLSEERELVQAQAETLTQQLIAAQESADERQRAWEDERKKMCDEMMDIVCERKESGGGGRGTGAAELDEMARKLQRARDGELEALSQLSSTSAELRARVVELEDQLAESKGAMERIQSKGEGSNVLRLRSELRSAERQRDEAQSALEAAQREKISAITVAQRRVEAAEARVEDEIGLRGNRAATTTHVGNLQTEYEARISELSTLLGRAQASRAEDARTIDKLRDEVDCLTEELRGAHGAAASAGGSASGGGGGRDVTGSGDKDAHDDGELQMLREKVTKLKSLLYLSNQRVAELASAPVTLATEDLDLSIVPPPVTITTTAEGEEGKREAKREEKSDSAIALSLSSSPSPPLVLPASQAGRQKEKGEGSDVGESRGSAEEVAMATAEALIAARREVRQYYERAKALQAAKHDAMRQAAAAVRARDRAEAATRQAREEADAAAATEMRDDMQREMGQLRARLDALPSELRRSHQEELADLQSRNERARQRAIAMLSEKDAEITRLRSAVSLLSSSADIGVRSGSGRRKVLLDQNTHGTTTTAAATSPSPIVDDPNPNPNPNRDTPTDPPAIATSTTAATTTTSASPSPSPLSMPSSVAYFQDGRSLPSSQSFGAAVAATTNATTTTTTAASSSTIASSTAAAAAAADGLTVGGPLVHLQNLNSQRAAERAKARARIQDLEMDAQEAAEQMTLVREQCAALKEEIRRLERNARREGANLEYLKNVLLKALDRSAPGRKHALEAVATILEFSPAELKRVTKQQNSINAATSSLWPSWGGGGK